MQQLNNTIAINLRVRTDLIRRSGTISNGITTNTLRVNNGLKTHFLQAGFDEGFDHELT